MDATYFWTDCTAREPAPNTAEVGRGVYDPAVDGGQFSYPVFPQ